MPQAIWCNVKERFSYCISNTDFPLSFHINSSLIVSSNDDVEFVGLTNIFSVNDIKTDWNQICIFDSYVQFQFNWITVFSEKFTSYSVTAHWIHNIITLTEKKVNKWRCFGVAIVVLIFYSNVLISNMRSVSLKTRKLLGFWYCFAFNT